MQILQLDYVAQRRAWEAERVVRGLEEDADGVLAMFEEEEDADGVLAMFEEEEEDEDDKMASNMQIQGPPRNTDQISTADIYPGNGMDVPDVKSDSCRMPDGHTRAIFRTQQPPSSIPEKEAEELEEILEAENRDFEALIAMSGSEGLTQPPWLGGIQSRSSSPMYGSEDDEFEQLMLELSEGAEEMDLSTG